MADDTDNKSDEEAKKAFAVQIRCQMAEGSIEHLDTEDDETREYESKRFEKYKRKALDLANEIEDDFYHGMAIHCVVSLCLKARQVDEAKELIGLIRDDWVQEKALAEIGEQAD